MDDASAFDPLRHDEAAAASAERPQETSDWAPIVPVPEDAPPMDYEDRNLGPPHKTWVYRDANGRIAGYMCRWDHKDDTGKKVKTVRPVTYCDLGDGTWGWRAKGVPSPRPLYALPEILARTEATVIITEGEKARDAAAQLFPDMVATTSMFGAQAPEKTDFAPLAGRTVIIATDYDAPQEGEGRDRRVGPGRSYGDKVLRLLKKAGAQEILHLRPADVGQFVWQDGKLVGRPTEIPDGWDLADAIDDGWSAETIGPYLEGEDLLLSYQDTETEDDDGKFCLTEHGVEQLVIYRNKKGREIGREWIWLCSPLKIVAMTRDEHKQGWGLLVRLTNPDGDIKELVVPKKLLAGEGAPCRELLLSEGLMLAPGKAAQERLQAYLLAAFPPTRVLTATRSGWVKGAFVLPHRTISAAPDAERVIYLGGSTFDTAYTTAGEIAAWQSDVAAHAVGNSRLGLALAAAFVGPALELTGSESGGFHFRGPSSIGKTTALAVAASVWGDPTFVRNWRATANGLEGAAQAASDTLLILDEIGQCTGKEAGAVAYMLANGQGKTRSNNLGNARRVARWKTMFLSTGEVSVNDKMLEDSSLRGARPGQQVRMIDIPADADAGLGLFETLHGFESPNALARHLKEATARNYGHAAVAFIEHLVCDREQSTAALAQAQHGFISEYCPQGADGQVQRAAHRFALIAAVGELAARIGILPWEDGEATWAAATCFNAWIKARGGVESAEVTAAIERVRHFLEQYGESRFVALKELSNDVNDSDRPIHTRVGFRGYSRDGAEVFYIQPEVWRQDVCRGLDPMLVARLLAERGMLVTTKGRLQVLHRVPGSRNPRRFYAVTSAIFEQDDSEVQPSPSSWDIDEFRAKARDPSHFRRPDLPGISARLNSLK